MATNDLAANERSIAAVIRVAEKSLGDLLDESGTVLFSSSETLKPGNFYFLGLNPGGLTERTKTIRETLIELESGDWTDNAYLDQDWSGTKKYKTGFHPVQKNFKCLFEALGEDQRSVCASNLIFRRSSSEIDAGGREMAERCWPVHETIIQEIVKPCTIITFGITPFNFIHSKLSGTPAVQDKCGHGSWTWRYSILAEGRKLIGLPHLSRYSLQSNPAVTEKIRNLIGPSSVAAI